MTQQFEVDWSGLSMTFPPPPKNHCIITTTQDVFLSANKKKAVSELHPFSRNIYYDSFTAAPGELGYGGTLSECEVRSEAEPQSPGFAFGTSSDCTVTWRKIFLKQPMVKTHEKVVKPCKKE